MQESSWWELSSLFLKKLLLASCLGGVKEAWLGTSTDNQEDSKHLGAWGMTEMQLKTLQSGQVRHEAHCLCKPYRVRNSNQGIWEG